MIISRGVTTIENGAFYNNRLTSLVVPKSVSHIEYNAFQQNPQLTSVCVEATREEIRIDLLAFGPAAVITFAQHCRNSGI